MPEQRRCFHTGEFARTDCMVHCQFENVAPWTRRHVSLCRHGWTVGQNFKVDFCSETPLLDRTFCSSTTQEDVFEWHRFVQRNVKCGQKTNSSSTALTQLRRVIMANIFECVILWNCYVFWFAGLEWTGGEAFRCEIIRDPSDEKSLPVGLSSWAIRNIVLLKPGVALSFCWRVHSCQHLLKSRFFLQISLSPCHVDL